MFMYVERERCILGETRERCMLGETRERCERDLCEGMREILGGEERRRGFRFYNEMY